VDNDPIAWEEQFCVMSTPRETGRYFRKQKALQR
jgi:hypothetical protein